MNRRIWQLPREMSKKERREIRKLVESMCANYDDYYNECLVLEGHCYMFDKCYTDNFCKYFQKVVLPLNPILKTSLAYRNIDKNCKVCGEKFQTTSKEVYCSPNCRRIGRNKDSAERMRKKRKKRKDDMLRNGVVETA